MGKNNLLNTVLNTEGSLSLLHTAVHTHPAALFYNPHTTTPTYLAGLQHEAVSRVDLLLGVRVHEVRSPGGPLHAGHRRVVPFLHAHASPDLQRRERRERERDMHATTFQPKSGRRACDLKSRSFFFTHQSGRRVGQQKTPDPDTRDSRRRGSGAADVSQRHVSGERMGVGSGVVTDLADESSVCGSAVP